MNVNKKFFTYFLYFRQVMIISVQVITAISAIAAIFLLTTSNEDLHATYNVKYAPFKLRHVVAIRSPNNELTGDDSTAFCDSPVMKGFNRLFENALEQQYPDTLVHSYYRYLQQNNSEARNYCRSGFLKYELDTTDFASRFNINLLEQSAKISNIISEIHEILRYTTPEQFDVHFYGYAQEVREDQQIIELLFTAIFFVPVIYIIYLRNKMNFLLVSLLSWANSFLIGTSVVFFASIFTDAFNYKSVLTSTTIITVIYQLLFAKRFETSFHLNRLYFEQKENASIEIIERDFQIEEQSQLLKSIQMGITIPRTQKTNQNKILNLQYETIVKTSYNFFSDMLASETILLCCYAPIFAFIAIIPHVEFTFIALFSVLQCIVCYGVNFFNTNAMIMVCENMFFRSHNVFRDKFSAKSAYEILIQEDDMNDDLPIAPQEPINSLLEFIHELSNEENEDEYLNEIEDGGSEIMEQREKQKLLYKEIVGSSQSKLAKVLNVKIAMREIQSQRFARIIIYIVYLFGLTINLFCLCNIKYGIDFSSVKQRSEKTEEKELFAKTYSVTDIFPVEFAVTLSRPINSNLDLDRLFLATIQMFEWNSFVAPYFVNEFYSFSDIDEISKAIAANNATPEEIRVYSFYEELGGTKNGLHHFTCRLQFNQSVDGEDFYKSMEELKNTLNKANTYLEEVGADFSMTTQIGSIQAVLSDNFVYENSCFWGYFLFVAIALYIILSFANRSFIAGLKFLICTIFLDTSGMAAIYIIFQLFYEDPDRFPVEIPYIIAIVTFVIQCEFDVKMRSCTELNRASMSVAASIQFDLALFLSSCALFITLLPIMNLVGFSFISLAFVQASYVCPYLYTALSTTFYRKK